MGYPAHDPGTNVSTATTIGELIRERRLSRGFSLGQLATQLGLAPAVVRSWELGEVVPAPDLFPELATALDVDPAGIAALHVVPEVVTAQDSPLEETDALEQESAAVETAASDPVVEIPASRVDTARAESASLPVGETYSDVGATTASVVADMDDATGDDLSVAGSLVGAQQHRQVPEPVSFDHVGSISVVEPGITEAPTEAISRPVAPLAPARFEPVAVVEDTAETARRRRIPNPLEIFFDPARRWLYWIRYALTIVVLLVLLRVLLWAGGELWSALGELLDTFSSTEDAEETLRVLSAV